MNEKVETNQGYQLHESLGDFHDWHDQVPPASITECGNNPEEKGMMPMFSRILYTRIFFFLPERLAQTQLQYRYINKKRWI